ncbi:MAG: gliding motility protein GldN [Bacteroidota bacterium]
MKLRILLILVAVLMAGNSFAQDVLDGVYVKEHTTTRTPLAYPHLREADVAWSKRVWRLIDLNEKINLPLRYPRTKDTKDRKSLIDVVLDAVAEGSLTAYSDEEFVTPLTLTEIYEKGGARTDTQRLQRPDPPYEEYDTVIAKEFSRDNVIGYRMKEDWYFEKQRSVMEVRIIGMAPLVLDRNEAGEVREGNVKLPLFWFYYPEARQLLANAEVFNRYNDSERRSFDDVFQKRMFSSIIIKESNVANIRIEDYRTGLNALLESERIKNEITNMEHDMWEY